MNGVLHIPQTSKDGASPSDCLVSYPRHSLGVLPVCRDVDSVFSRHSRLGCPVRERGENKKANNIFFYSFIYGI